MANFSYIARNMGGTKVHGTLAAANEQAVLAELHARQLAPLQVMQEKDTFEISRGVNSRQLAGAYRQTADLLRAGVPLLRALRLLGRSKSNPRLSAIISDVADQVAEGTRLADAMGRHERVFPEVQVAMINAGERGGFLEQVLQRLSFFLEKRADMRSKVLGNMIYPVVLLTVGAGIMIAALVFFVPQFKDMYAGIEIPTPTKILLAMSALLTEHWLWLIIAVVAFLIASIWLLRQPGFRREAAKAQLRLPKVGALVRALAVARFCRTMGTLLENGVPVLASMHISKQAAGHVLMAEAIEAATEAVRGGETLAQPLAASGLFDEDVIEMISVGETANNLPEVLITVAETIEGRIDRMLTMALRLLEPLLLLVLAMVVVFLFLALVLPMIRMSTSM